jgi:hypothetical protein
MREKMLIMRIFGVLLLACLPAIGLPKPVTSCLARHPDLTLNHAQKPLFLQVFFSDSMKTPDYVVVVRERQSSYNRALVCMHDGKDVLLGGSTKKEPFSDMKNDNYMSSNWRVCTKADVAKLRQYYSDVPEPANQAICLTWEDAEGLIYWDGRRFCWKSLWP